MSYASIKIDYNKFVKLPTQKAIQLIEILTSGEYYKRGYVGNEIVEVETVPYISHDDFRLLPEDHQPMSASEYEALVEQFEAAEEEDAQAD